MIRKFYSFWNLFYLDDSQICISIPAHFFLHSVLCCPLGHCPSALLLLPKTKCGEYGDVSFLGNLSSLHSFAVPSRDLTRLIILPLGSAFSFLLVFYLLILDSKKGAR